MRTTIDLPEDLILRAMEITQSKTKIETIRKALEWLIKYEERKSLINYRGKVDLEVDVDVLRGRSEQV